MLNKWKKTARVVTGFALTGIFVWLLSGMLSLEELLGAFSQLTAADITTALICLAIGYFFRIVRWWWMLRAIDDRIRLSACVWPFLTSIAVNNIAPLRAGDALRTFGFRRQLRAPVARVLSTLVIERLFDLLALLVILGLCFQQQSSLTRLMPEPLVTAVTWLTLTAVILAVMALTISPWLLRELEQHQANWQHRPRQRQLAHHLIQFLHPLATLRSAGILLPVTAFSGLAWCFEGLVFVTLAGSVATLASSIAAWFALALGTLSTLIPSSPGYVGTFDYFVAQAMVLSGVTQAEAAAFAVVVHLQLWLPLTVTGMAYFIYASIRTRSGSATPSYQAVTSGRQGADIASE